MGKIMNSTFFDVMNRQDYDVPMFLQKFPVLGPIVSVPTALVSGVMAIVKVALAIFNKIINGSTFFAPNDETEARYDRTKYPMEDAIDLSIIFANNIINICTAGILNNIIFNLVNVS